MICGAGSPGETGFGLVTTTMTESPGISKKQISNYRGRLF